MENKQSIMFTAYHRNAVADVYPGGLAYSVHLAYSLDGLKYQSLNKNYGILFEQGDVRGDNTIFPKGVRDPKIFYMEDTMYGICGRRTREDGSPDDNCMDKILLWTTKDFIEFERVGLVDPLFIKQWMPADFVEVDKAVAQRAIEYWSPIENTALEVPDYMVVNSEKELDEIKAMAVYSDGSHAVKEIHWDKTEIDFENPGIYDVTGAVGTKPMEFPLAKGYGDPVLLKWEGKWYFVATNDNLNDIGIYVREADTVEGLFAEEIQEHLILPFDEKRGLEQTFWAPEFHVIGEELYLLFAVSGHAWGPQCHVMRLKKGMSIIREESWEDPIPVVRADGSALAPEAISLDMTYIHAESGSYMVWSYRKFIGTPKDTGSMLYIATVDEEEPWRLTSAPMLLTRPLYGWENVDGTINNEGPYCFIRGGKVYLTYSGGSANRYTYALGLLTADETSDLTDISSWKKSITPVLTYYSVAGEYGPGHNSFYVNDAGELMIAYHAETDIKESLRCDGIRRVHFRRNGRPDFELSSQQDLREEFRVVKRKIIIK